MKSEQNPRYKTRVETTVYVFAHGKAPRGRGSWAFCLVNPNRADYLAHVLWKNDMTYGQAKRSALNDVAGRLPTIWVCS